MSSHPPRAFRMILVMSCVGLLALAGGVTASYRWWRVEADPPPLDISFFGGCRVPQDRGQAYDPERGVFHVEFGGYAEHGFDVVKVDEGANQPVIFHLTGLPDLYGFNGLPLTLAVDGKNYLIDLKRDPGDHPEYDLIRDDTLFRVESKYVTEYTYERPARMIEVTVEFTEKGRSLLKPGARIFCVMLTYW
jgi:hypothetical protein